MARLYGDENFDVQAMDLLKDLNDADSQALASRIDLEIKSENDALHGKFLRIYRPYV